MNINSEFSKEFIFEKKGEIIQLNIKDNVVDVDNYQIFEDKFEDEDIINILNYYALFYKVYSYRCNEDIIEVCYSNELESVDHIKVTFIEPKELGISNKTKLYTKIQSWFLNEVQNKNKDNNILVRK